MQRLKLKEYNKLKNDITFLKLFVQLPAIWLIGCGFFSILKSNGLWDNITLQSVSILTIIGGIVLTFIFGLIVICILSW